MQQRIFVVFALLIAGLGLGLGTSSCGPICPSGEQSCGTQNGSGSVASAGAAGAAGAAGSSNDATCAYLTAVQSCMDDFCKTATNPFCTCYERGFDLAQDCTCIAFDPKAFCDQAAATGADSATYDCSSRSGAVASICVGVQ